MAVPLRAVGAGRLDWGPINQIRVNLERCGLASTELVREQGAYALIYDPSRPLGQLIRASSGDHADSDEQIRQALRGPQRPCHQLPGQQRQRGTRHAARYPAPGPGPRLRSEVMSSLATATLLAIRRAARDD